MTSTSREFRDKGVIKQISVENFVTYTKAVVSPGRGLNVIIGPNGTGKSTIVAAIVLGLGGNPAVLGKKIKVLDFIRAGSEKARIEIVLKESEGKVVSLGRTFDNRGHNTWSMDGAQISTTKFKEVVDTFNIQVDNLCQFLPQDKVADFSKMGATELLQNTEKSVGDGTLFGLHEDLKKERVHQRNLETTIKSKEDILNDKSQKYQDLSRFVEGIKERKNMKKKVESLQQKIAWTKYDVCRTQLIEAKKTKEDAEQKKIALEEQLKPANKTIESVEAQIREMDRKVESFKLAIAPHYKKFKNDLENARGINDSIRGDEQACKLAIEDEETRDQEIAQANQILSKLENDLEVMKNEIGTPESFKLKMTQAIAAMDRHRTTHNGNMNWLAEKHTESKTIIREIANLEALKKTLQDVESEKLRILKSRDPNAYEGTIWLRQNTDKFRCKVHEPMMLNIQPKHLKYAKYLESTVPMRDLFAFVCEDVSDMNLLLRYLREEKRLIINVIHADPRREVDMTPNIPIENLRRFGFENYLLALFDAPETILKYLVENHSLHNIPVGSDAVERCIDSIPSQLRRFYSASSAYTVSVSKYSGEKATSISTISSNKLLSTIVDTARIRQLECDLEKLMQRQERLDQERSTLQANVQDGDREMERLRSEKARIAQESSQVENLRKRVGVAKDKVRTLEEDRKSPELIQSEMKIKAQKYIARQLKLYDQMNNAFKESIDITSKSERFKFEVQMKRRVLARLKNESQDLRNDLRIAKEDVDHLNKKLQPLLEKVKNLFDAAKETTEGISNQQKDEFKKFNASFAKLPTGLEEMEVELQKARAKVHCLGNNQDGERILQEYETTEKSIGKLKEEIDTLKIEYGANKLRIDELKQNWYGPLQALVSRINNNFQKYFKMMDCNGEVSLEPGENPNEFKDYGLKIRVKFRSSDELQELTRERQSGGERAVTTGIFMISLQELSRVPFRCVDEINQGMDATNERKVFQLIVKMAASKDSSQYFLLTPKLLPNLEYGEHVTVHCVFNGPFVVPHEKWNINKYCKKTARRHEKRQHA